MRTRRAAAALVTIVTLCGCASDPDGPSANGEATELTVFAASSLTDAFTEMGEGFEATHPGVTVVFNFGASTDLAEQIASEGTADVFASASGAAMDTVAEDPGVEALTNLATNRLVVVTPVENPAGVASIHDLASEGVQVVLGAEGVPVGDYARESLANAGILDAVLANVVSNEDDNASVVAKIVANEADAAIVYASDVSAAASNALASVEVPDDVNVIATYPIAIVVGSANPGLAAEFQAAAIGEDGRAVLAEYGFGPPT